MSDLCPDGVLISPKNDPTRGMGAGLSSPYGRSFTFVGFKGTDFPALMVSYVAQSMVFAVAPESMQTLTGVPSMVTVISDFSWVGLS